MYIQQTRLLWPTVWMMLGLLYDTYAIIHNLYPRFAYFKMWITFVIYSFWCMGGKTIMVNLHLSGEQFESFYLFSMALCPWRYLLRVTGSFPRHSHTYMRAFLQRSTNTDHTIFNCLSSVNALRKADVLQTSTDQILTPQITAWCFSSATESSKHTDTCGLSMLMSFQKGREGIGLQNLENGSDAHPS